jgi:SAM-dependent methyltransferase
MFTESASLYDAIYSFKDYAGEARQIAALVRQAHPGARTILDVACGTGEHARHLASAHGFEVDGLDLDPGLLGVARAKHPAGTFFEADMAGFALGRRYDVILCLFSSIGYLVTIDRVEQAMKCFREHLRPSGLLLLEPWFPPGVLEDGRVMRQTGTCQGRTVERVSRCELDGRVSRLWFDYTIETSTGVRHVSEVHELGVFRPDEMASAFETAGLLARFDPEGLTGRGLWIARCAEAAAGEGR